MIGGRDLFCSCMPLLLPNSSVSLSYFVLAVPMLEYLGKYSCMSSPCPIAILNGTFLFFARRNSLTLAEASFVKIKSN